MSRRHCKTALAAQKIQNGDGQSGPFDGVCPCAQFIGQNQTSRPRQLTDLYELNHMR